MVRLGSIFLLLHPCARRDSAGWRQNHILYVVSDRIASAATAHARGEPRRAGAVGVWGLGGGGGLEWGQVGLLEAGLPHVWLARWGAQPPPARAPPRPHQRLLTARLRHQASVSYPAG